MGYRVNHVVSGDFEWS